MTKMWSLTSALLLAGLLMALWVYPKFFAGYEIHPVFGWSEAVSGVAFFDPYLRWIVGAAAAITAVLLVIPATRFVGGLLALAVSGFYVALHASPWLGFAPPPPEAVTSGLAAGLPVETIQASIRGEDAHFVMTLVILSLAAVAVGSEMATRSAAKRPKRLATFGFSQA